jgi:hypothetical protein
MVMREIVEYCTAVESSRTDLDTKVNEMIKHGYQPFGSPYVKDNSYPCQAMVKYANGGSAAASGN